MMIFKLASNRIKLAFKNRGFIIICIFLPMLFSMLAGRIFSKDSLYDGVPIGIIDEDHSELSQKIVDGISKNKSLITYKVSKRDIESLISHEKVQAIYIFNKGFEESIKYGEYEETVEVYTVSGSITAMGVSDIIAGEIMPYITKYRAVKYAASILKREKLSDISSVIGSNIEKYNNDPDFNMPVQVEIKNPNLSGIKAEVDTSKDLFSGNMTLGMLVIFLMLFMLQGCSSIIYERKSGIVKRIEAAGISHIKIVFGDVLGLFVLGIFFMLIEFVFIRFTFYSGSLRLICEAFFVTMFYVLAIAVFMAFLAGIFNSQVTFQSFMPVVILVMGIVSGCLSSLELLPKKIALLARLTPSYYAQKSIVNLLIYKSSLYSCLENIFSLLIMALIYFWGIFFIFSFRKK